MDTISASSPKGCGVTSDIHVDSSFDPMKIPSGFPVHPMASASPSGSYLLSGNAIQVSCYGSVDGSVLADATATVAISDTLTTDGPVREGVTRGYFLTSKFRNGANVSARIVSPVLPYETFEPADPAMTMERGHPLTLLMTGSADSPSDSAWKLRCGIPIELLQS